MGNRLDGGVRLNYLGKSGENIIIKIYFLVLLIHYSTE